MTTSCPVSCPCKKPDGQILIPAVITTFLVSHRAICTCTSCLGQVHPVDEYNKNYLF